MKSLCVYCSSSDRLDPKYYVAARAVGIELARRRWALVFGGGKTGLMGAVARGAKENGGYVVGVIPDFMKSRELAFTAADELISVATMRERKTLMEARADAFLALPGGWGTLEELLEVLTLAHLDLMRKPIVILNQQGYYDELLSLFERMIREQFMHGTSTKKYAVALSVAAIFPLLENWINGVDQKPWYDTQ